MGPCEDLNQKRDQVTEKCLGTLFANKCSQTVETICLGTIENWFLLRNCMAWWHFASLPVFVHPVPGPEFSYFRPRSFGWPVFGLAEPRRCWRTHPKTGVLDLQLSCATYSWPKCMLPWPSPFWSPGHWMEFSEIFLECFCSCVGCLALLQWHNCVFPALAWRGLMETSVRNSLGCWKKRVHATLVLTHGFKDIYISMGWPRLCFWWALPNKT